METPAQSSPNIQPQAAPQPQGPVNAQPAGQPSSQPSGRGGQEYNPQLLQQIEQHLNSVPPEQKAFVAKYMTPELAVVLGIIIGNEAFDYFKQYADPKKELMVQERKGQEKKSGTQPQQTSAHIAPQQTNVQSAPQSMAQPQPKANIPAKSIMGV